MGVKEATKTTKKKSKVIVGLVIIAIFLFVPFLFVLFFMPFIFTGDLDRYQTQQTEMAKVYLSEQLGVGIEEIASEGGSAGPFLYDHFSIELRVGEKRYTVIHENTQLRAIFGLKGQMRMRMRY